MITLGVVSFAILLAILCGGASVGIEAHNWRGIHVSPFGQNDEGHLFLKWVRIGFVSFSFNRGSLIDRLLTMLERVK